MQNTSTSPTTDYNPSDVITATPPKLLNFAEIIKPLLEGKLVTKQEWNNSAITVFVKNERLTIKKADGSTHDLILRSCDLSGDDWLVI